MKYRIKEVKTNEKNIFMPQYSHLGLIWCHWYKHYDPMFSKDLIYDTYKEAEIFIKKQCNKKVKETTYHKVKCEENYEID